MANEKKTCVNCWHCKELYTKGLGRFVKQKWLLCYKHKKIIEKQGSCNYWEYNSEFRKNLKKQTEIEASMKIFDVMQKNLSEIRQILGDSLGDGFWLPPPDGEED